MIKIYDISTFDVTGMIATKREDLGPHASFLGPDQSLLAVSSGQNVLVFSVLNLEKEPIKTITLHASPITAMAYNSVNRCMVSADLKGVLEVWDCSSEAEVGSAPTSTRNGLEYTSKMDTQLYELMRKKTFAVSLAVSPTGQHFCVYGEDHRVRIYHHASGKIVVTYDERAKMYDRSFSAPPYNIDGMDYGKRAAVEREMAQETIFTGGILTDDTLTNQYQLMTLTFDPTGKYLLLPTLAGIKLIEWQRNKLVKIIGQHDASALRFVSICLCSGDAKVNRQMQLARSGGSKAAMDHDKARISDSLIVALAYRKRRLYVFSHFDPLEQDNVDDDMAEDVLLRRDVLNEPPDAEDRLVMGDTASKAQALGSEAILRTSMGDIHIKLFPKECPRTVQNFCGHAKSGYYDNVIFHRVIKGFMLQTGDPLGDGTGGESIWGGEFEDEFVRTLRHDRPFTVSMANAGPNTNVSFE
jgi:peptidylprolyl isomerase domain and WD repeat-containing protein 1